MPVLFFIIFIFFNLMPHKTAIQPDASERKDRTDNRMFVNIANGNTT